MLKTFRYFIGRFLWILMGMMIVTAIIAALLCAYMEYKLPDVSVLNDVHMQVPLRIYTSDGKLMGEYGVKRRAPVTIDQVPKQLIQAIIATEDARFYSHPGVDLIGIVRAAIAVITTGRKVQGASTITMQVARNFFLSPKKTYTRKLKEILLAVKIDKTLSKEKILELYLNKVYFGNRAYGVSAAAHVYYGKSLNKLTLPEMAMIAGLPQAPSRNNPISNPKNALLRRNHVLKRMLDVRYITEKEYAQAIKASLNASYHDERTQANAPYVAEMVRQALVMMHGVRAYDSGLKVTTTISSKLQQDAVKSLQSGLIAYSERHGFEKPKINLGLPTEENRELWVAWLGREPSMDGLQPAIVLSMEKKAVEILLANGSMAVIPWEGLSWARPALFDGYVGARPRRANQIVRIGDVVYVTYLTDQKRWQLAQVPKAQGAIIALNPKTGAILALQGGFDFDFSSFNRVLQAQRQPGSNFKPFLYSAALAKGFTLASTINDAPLMIRGTGENNWWRPQNDNDEFYGPTRLRVALAESRNLVSIRLLRAIGIPYALDYLQNFGFNPDQLPHELSLALGTADLTPLQIANGYAIFANGGNLVKPYFIEKITTENNHVIYEAPTHQPHPVITPQNAYLMTQAMRSVIQSGTGRAAKVLKRTDLAGKTGTTNDQVDAWFSGFNSNLITTVWVGYDNHQESLHEYGAQVALPIWIQFMKAALDNQPEATMPQPNGIIIARIDPRTGYLASARNKRAIFEVFEQQDEPKQLANNDNASSDSDSDSTAPDDHVSSSAEDEIF